LAELDESQFVRQMLIRGGQIAWFLGAGASAGAGIPTAGHMIMDFKASLFASAHGIRRRDIDADDPLWIDRISRYFDGANGFPANGDPREYETAFQTMYHSAEDRRRYMAGNVQRGTSSYGHRVLASLLVTRHTPLVFTTNFDQLIEQACASINEVLDAKDRAHLAVSALNSTDVADRCIRENDWPLLVKLHGDYQSVSMKNTDAELQQQDQTLRFALTESVRRFGLAIVGYSGRDHSVMEALNEGLKSPTPYPGGIYWLRRPGNPLLPEVEHFLESAEKAGVDAYTVESETFDELFGAVDRQHAFPAEITTRLQDVAPSDRVVDVVLPETEAQNFPVLRFNALQVTSLPDRVFNAKIQISTVELRSAIREVKARADAVSTGSEVLGFGSTSSLTSALGAAASNSVFGVRAVDLQSDTIAFGLVYQSLARALCRDRPFRFDLRSSGHTLHLINPSTLRDAQRKRKVEQQLASFRTVYGDDLFGALQKLGGRRYSEGVRLRLENRLDRWWLIFEPFTWVQRDSSVRPDPAAPWIRERWYSRRNDRWASIMDVWARELAPSTETTISAWGDSDGDIDAVFRLAGTTAWARPGQGGVR
jgi:hypothetical protein